MIGSTPWARRSARAASMVGRLEAGTYAMACRAPSELAASASPSRTRWGACDRSKASLRLAGSPSAPLATTTGRRREAVATARHLVATGNQAPPCPTSPLASSSSRRPCLNVSSPHRFRCVRSPGSAAHPEASPCNRRAVARGFSTALGPRPTLIGHCSPRSGR